MQEVCVQQIGLLLQAMRISHGISLGQVALAADLSNKQLADIERGLGGMPISMYAAAARVLGMELRLIRHGEPTIRGS